MSIPIFSAFLPAPPPLTGLDLSRVAWLHGDVSGWPRTSRMTAVRFEQTRLGLEHTKAGLWPAKTVNGTVLEGNPWVVAKRGDRWSAATYEWLRPGQTWKSITAENIGAHIKTPPLDAWVPRQGELVGLFVSTLARDGQRTINERSDIVMVRWGEDTIVWREGGRVQMPSVLKTNFLSLHDPIRLFPHLLPSLSRADQDAVIRQHVEAGANGICVYAANGGDYATLGGSGVAFDFYPRPNDLVPLLQRCRDAGVPVLLWLMADDSPGLHRKYDPSDASAMRLVENAIDIWDPYVVGYVGGLESDEYRNAANDLLWLQTIARATSRSIGVHLTSGRWSRVGIDWWRKTPGNVDRLYYQYTTDQAMTESRIAATTRDLVSRLSDIGGGRRIQVVASEWPSLLGREHLDRSNRNARAALSVPGCVGSTHGF